MSSASDATAQANYAKCLKDHASDSKTDRTEKCASEELAAKQADL